MVRNIYIYIIWSCTPCIDTTSTYIPPATDGLSFNCLSKPFARIYWTYMCIFIDACMLLSLGVGVHVLAVLQVFMASVSVCVSQLAGEDTEPHVKVNTHTVHMHKVSVLKDGIWERGNLPQSDELKTGFCLLNMFQLSSPNSPKCCFSTTGTSPNEINRIMLVMFLQTHRRAHAVSFFKMQLNVCWA